MQEIKDFMAVSTQRGVEQARARIERIRAALPEFDLVCSGTLVRRMIKCGRPNCRCASDPESRHGPYWQWGHMRAGKPTHRYVSEQQATVLRQAIANHRQIKKLLNDWEDNTERIVNALQPPKP